MSLGSRVSRFLRPPYSPSFLVRCGCAILFSRRLHFSLIRGVGLSYNFVSKIEPRRVAYYTLKRQLESESG